MKAPNSLSTNIIYLCGEFSHLFHQMLTREFKENGIGVTVEQFSVLAMLFYQNGLSQQEISDVLGRDKTTVARVISIMERDNMVTRVTNENDNRGKLIYLTRKGRSIQQKAVGVSGKLYLRAISNLKESELKAAIKVMTSMTANLSKTEKIK
ncbi:MAG TPA: MarR family transcriptional regulator [Chryseolinea sp.]|nr:MarR family transcriptional regulator [Chryseolinea sp.]